MGRRSGGGGGRSSSRSYSSGWPKFRSTPSHRKKPSPKPVKDEKDEKAHPPSRVETTHGETRSGRFFSSIVDGFGWGSGNAMGHRFVESIFGPRTIKTEIVLPEKVEVAAVSAKDNNDKFKDYTESCSISYNAFQDCLNVEGNNLSKCHIFMDSLFECRKNSSSFNF
ncbi:hypothetical protein EUTSA_v10019238mg [Eutrema salsugineum]|uniref:CHCH domain-containing protein n=1 Tax=Eutrema salsugineum TaxID=72664 RepID=V4MAN0_EUTSA|nr:uncharacterized protein LOC18009185 [Eutrema salsugineum]ESQ28241.1 hypothetical protein EUTSA_v10019238mg [Eutrema salsugineum]